jgi:hypothetical protein
MTRLTSGISGAWACSTFYNSPEMRADLMLAASPSAACLVAFSVGVHLAESVNMVCHNKPSNLLVHHVFAIICFIGAFLTGKAVGFAVLSLVTEINNVFNKTRILHLVAGVSRVSEKFQNNARINIATFTVRMAIMTWINYQFFPLLWHPAPRLPRPLQHRAALRQLLEYFRLQTARHC